MLGDKLLFGQYNNRVDSMGRIFLPANSGREKGEIVYLVYDNDIQEYKIIPYSFVQTEFKKFKMLIDSAKTTEELTQYKLMLNNFSESILRESKIDGQGRITLLDSFVFNDDITIIGAGDHFILRQGKKK